MFPSNPLIQHPLRHLLAWIGSFVLLLLATAVVAPIVYPSLFQLAERISSDATDNYFHMFSTIAFDWRILLLLVIITHLVGRQIDTRRFWVVLPLLMCLFLILGVTFVGIDNWAAIQNREFYAIVTALMQGLHVGLQAASYWLVYVLSIRLFKKGDEARVA